MSFDTLGLAEPLLRAVHEQGYTTPTPIQAQAIPVVLQGGDLMGGAQTGTGKTAGFVLPMLHRLMATPAVRDARGKLPIRALILTPTRELAAQVEESVRNYGKYSKLTSMVMFGGVGMQPQIDRLRRGVDILVATPGRLLDHHGPGARSTSATSRSSCSTRPTACSTWASSTTSRRCIAIKCRRRSAEPALLGHHQRRDQGARRPAAQQPGADRGGPPQPDRPTRSRRAGATRSAAT